MRIAYTKRETKNLGNYENVSIEITIEDDVDFANETKDEAFDRISNFVKTKLEKQFNTDKLKANVSTTNLKSILVEIKAYILELIKCEPDNRLKIKELLAKYGVTKLQEIPNNKLANFYTDLKQLKE